MQSFDANILIWMQYSHDDIRYNLITFMSQSYNIHVSAIAIVGQKDSKHVHNYGILTVTVSCWDDKKQ